MNNTTAEDTQQVFTKISVATPLIYLFVLIGLLISFSVYHRRTKIHTMQTLTATPLFFPSHNAEWEQEEITGISTPDSTPAILFNDLVELNAHEKVLKSALVLRTSEAMRRLMKLKECEQGINMLYTRGLIGDDSFQHFKLQLKLQDAEMRDCVLTAEKMEKGWGQSQLIIGNAQEVTMNQALRRRVSAVDKRIETMKKLRIEGVEPILKELQKQIDELKLKAL